MGTKNKKTLPANQDEQYKQKVKEHLSSLINRIPIGVYLFVSSPDGSARFDFVSPKFCEIYNIAEEEFMREPSLAFTSTHPDDYESLIAANTHAVESGESFLWEGRFIVGGEIKWVDINSEPKMLSNGDILWSGLIKDITERKLIEEAHAENQVQHEIAQKIAHLGHWNLDLIKNDLAWSNESYRIFGLRPSKENTYEAFLKVVHPDDYEFVDKAYKESVKNNTPYNIEHRLLMQDGSIKWVHECCKTYYDDNGTPLHSIGTVQDITKCKKGEMELRKLSQAVHSAGEGIMITNDKAIIEYVNPAFTETTGYPFEEVIGKIPSMLKSDAQEPSFYKELWGTITSGKVWRGTLIDRRKDGTFYPALMSVSPIRDNEDKITHYVSMQQDMTEQKKLEDQFLQAQKMESMGTLVGGIAHDFNNMLNAVIANSYLARSESISRDKMLTHLDDINTLSYRAADMINQLLTFARKDTVSLQPLIFNSFLKEAYKLAKSAIPESISMNLEYPEKFIHVMGDSTQMQQVLMNLLNNARDALEDRPNPAVGVKLDEYFASDKFVQTHKLDSNHLARLTVVDNGIGIHKNKLDKVCEPFFTTKGEGKGTGLGLSMVLGAIQTHGGVIDVDSKVGEGTTVTIYLPIDKQVKDEQLIPDAGVVLGQGETILLVDDDEMLRFTSKEVLVSIGYTVLEAADGEQAIDMFTDHVENIQLVITDIIMPKLGGLEAVKSLRNLRPDIPVIFISGYGPGCGFDEQQLSSDTQLIKKPFQVVEISNVIHEMLST